MAHQQQRDFFQRVAKKYPDMFNEVSVLEIGSLDINGTVRDFFPNSPRYVGVDVEQGPGVDLVAHGEDLDLPDNDFTTVVSAECFEHNPAWLETFMNMIRMADQFVIFTCASTGRPEHGTTRTDKGSSPFTAHWDYYRNLEEKDFTDSVDLDEYFSEWAFEYNPTSCDLYFYGVKH